MKVPAKEAAKIIAARKEHTVDKFIFCPSCEGCNLEQTDYEDEAGEEDTDGRRCLGCGWEGDVSELVCIE